ncbi:MAG: hypothetical protein V2J51_17035 [Erythrobacter sp.]|nr:hypothetical protein [Erythrobacter sp.]
MKNIADAVSAMPSEVLDASGAVFYSAPPAFDGRRPIYILGLNPGGDPLAQAENTVRRQFENWQGQTKPYSSYVDEVWGGTTAGTHGMQPRIRHLAEALDIDLRLTPASNVVFVRSATEAKLEADKTELLDACWPVHEAVIESLGSRVIICLGGTAGRWVRERVEAHKQIDCFKETNGRGWTSVAHRSANGVFVCSLTHPGRVDWRNPDADPSPMVNRVVKAAGLE